MTSNFGYKWVQSMDDHAVVVESSRLTAARSDTEFGDTIFGAWLRCLA